MSNFKVVSLAVEIPSGRGCGSNVMTRLSGVTIRLTSVL